MTEVAEGCKGDGSPTGGGSLAAEGLGVGSNIPRCLRWPAGKMVQMQEMGIHETEHEIESIWKVSSKLASLLSGSIFIQSDHDPVIALLLTLRLRQSKRLPDPTSSPTLSRSCIITLPTSPRVPTQTTAPLFSAHTACFMHAVCTLPQAPLYSCLPPSSREISANWPGLTVRPC